MKLFIKDPVTGIDSVSLTLLIATFILVVAAGGLEMFDLVKNTSIFSELYYASAGLYFGRRLNINNKLFSSDPVEKIEQQIKEQIKE